MTSQERLEAGIWKALLNRPYELAEGCPCRIDHRVPEDAIREQFFADESVKTASTVGARNVLILCGDMHVDSLKAILEARGYEANADHSLIPERHWK